MTKYARKSLAQRGSLFDRIFRTRSGEIVIAQVPNAPLVVVMVAFLVQLFTTGLVSKIANITFVVAAVVWAGWELISGVTWFRRGLGAAVLLAIIWAQVTLL